MRVLVISDKIDLPESHIFLGLAEKGVEVTIYCNPTSPHQERLKHGGVVINHLAIKSRIEPSVILRMRAIMPAFDIVHFFSNRALSNGLIAALGLQVKCVAYRGTVGHLSRFDPLSWLTYLSPRLNGVVCVSKAVENYLLSLKVAPAKLITIHKGHERGWYTSEAIDRATFGISPTSSIITCAANFRPVKGGSYLIRSFLDIDPELNAHLVLVGEIRDREMKKLLNSERLNTRIHSLGFRKDVSSVIGMSDIFAMPSIDREGLPKAVIEAMARGVPPIVTAVGGLPELVKDGQSGLVVAPRSVSALKEAITRLIVDRELSRKLGQGAINQIDGPFSVKHSIDQTFNWYGSLLGSNNY
jgi:glycosyltransferase involved in cell wall biosynthesis